MSLSFGVRVFGRYLDPWEAMGVVTRGDYTAMKEGSSAAGFIAKDKGVLLLGV